MRTGALAIVGAWQEAVNGGSAARVRELSADQIEVLGPRGAGLMDSDELGAWMIRSGFSATPLRWFCGGDGNVVVEQAARWEDRATGVEQSHAVVGSHFGVADGVVARIGRHDGLAATLAAAGLATSDEVTVHR